MISLLLSWVLSGAQPALHAAAPSPTAFSGASVNAATTLARLAPAADPRVLELALSAMHCAQAQGFGAAADRLAVIDYRRSSLKPRLWVFDLAAGRLLFEEVVAHGQGSGGDLATRFSNLNGSHTSSVGLFMTRESYDGRNGYSMRMEGLEPGINDQALARAIVMHGAPYVDVANGMKQGRLGRSWGCPAVREAIARRMIDVLKGGQFVFAYYPDSDWLAQSELLRCPTAQASRSAS
jgi:hypothetical protein